MKGVRLAAAVLLAIFAFAANAGIKYWDNPAYKAFDVGDYVSGAVWNYDGIRNVGADQPHSTNALTWVNLGSAGANNNVFLQKAVANWPAASAEELASGTYGEWTENSFVFKGTSRMRCETGRIDAGTSYSLQFLLDAQSSVQQEGDGGFVLSVSSAYFALCINKADSKLYWRTKMSYNDSNNYSSLDGSSLDYVTAIVNGSDNTTALFDGIVPPASGDGFRQYASVSGHSEGKYCLGCTLSGGNAFIGTLKFFRYYNRALSNEELAWNRVVDEARFFGRQAPLPVTNVVVVSQVPFVNADQPNGCYALDASGFTFTAPATMVARRRTYSCTGYTVETWDGSAWSAPVAHDGETSYAATDGALVRLTWQWTAGDGLVTYDINDYVWDGLVWFYDGINNVGRDQPHSATATTWKNLGSSGSANDVFVQRLNAARTGWDTATNLDTVDGRNPGSWTENGFVLNGEGRFRCTGGIAAGNSYTFQQLMDVRASDQITGSAYPFGLNNAYMAFQLGKDSKLLFWRTQVNKAELAANYPYINVPAYDYVTAILNGTDNTARLFSGTTPPDSGSGFKQYESVIGHTENGYCFGGFGSANPDYRLIGTLKNFRYYDRVLSQAELVQNRAVDNWRYFHAPATTNIVVATTNPRLQGNEEDGAYEVVGSYTFTAPASVTVNNIAYTNDGYTVETWSAAGGWGVPAAYAGTSYAYTTAAGKVRLTWHWKSVRGLRSASDYSFDDYSQAGLFVNYDGILNAGRYLSRLTNTVNWVNLGFAGSANDLFVQRLNAGATAWDTAESLATVGGRDPGAWTENGFVLKGDSRFRCAAGAVGPVSSWSIQSLIDGDIADIKPDDPCAYVLAVAWANFSIVLGKNSLPRANCFYFNTQGANNRPNFQNESGKYDYATAIFDASDKTAKMFQGTTIPTSGGINDGFYQFGTVGSFQDTAYCIGGFGKLDRNQLFVGTVKSFRIYDRALTEEEIVRNRNIDAVRYFGELGVTNVYVVAGGEGAVQAEAGAYKVEGEWTFTAATTVDRNGETVPVERYSIETLSNGTWSSREYHNGNSYTYTEGTSPATVRLTWLGQSTGTLIVVQ